MTIFKKKIFPLVVSILFILTTCFTVFTLTGCSDEMTREEAFERLSVLKVPDVEFDATETFTYPDAERKTAHTYSFREEGWFFKGTETGTQDAPAEEVQALVAEVSEGEGENTAPEAPEKVKVYANLERAVYYDDKTESVVAFERASNTETPEGLFSFYEFANAKDWFANFVTPVKDEISKKLVLPESAANIVGTPSEKLITYKVGGDTYSVSYNNYNITKIVIDYAEAQRDGYTTYSIEYKYGTIITSIKDFLSRQPDIEDPEETVAADVAFTWLGEIPSQEPVEEPPVGETDPGTGEETTDPDEGGETITPEEDKGEVPSTEEDGETGGTGETTTE